jgi:hypothetical protein
VGGFEDDIGGSFLDESLPTFLILFLITLNKDFFGFCSSPLASLLLYLLTTILSWLGPLSVFACSYGIGSALLALFPRNLDLRPDNDGILFIDILVYFISINYKFKNNYFHI